MRRWKAGRVVAGSSLNGCEVGVDMGCIRVCAEAESER